MEVEQVVAAVVVVLPGTRPPVGVCAAALPVPNPRKFVHGRGLAPVQFGEETLLDGAAPALSAFGRDAQGHGQQVFLGVDDVHQPPQALRGVLAEADVDVDAAGTVGLCARRAFPASAPESPENRPRRAARSRARPAPPRPPRGLCAPHAGKPARARLPAAARKEGSGSPRPGSARRALVTGSRPGLAAPRPPRHTAASAPPPA